MSDGDCTTCGGGGGTIDPATACPTCKGATTLVIQQPADARGFEETIRYMRQMLDERECELNRVKEDRYRIKQERDAIEAALARVQNPDVAVYLRERDEAKRAAEEWEQYAKLGEERLTRTIQERDGARDAVGHWAKKHGEVLAKLETEKYEHGHTLRQRDEAIAKLESEKIASQQQIDFLNKDREAVTGELRKFRAACEDKGNEIGRLRGEVDRLSPVGVRLAFRDLVKAKQDIGELKTSLGNIVLERDALVGHLRVTLVLAVPSDIHDRQAIDAAREYLARFDEWRPLGTECRHCGGGYVLPSGRCDHCNLRPDEPGY